MSVFEKNEIINLLNKFVEFKHNNVLYLNDFIGRVFSIDVLEETYLEYDEKYRFKINFAFESVNDSWKENKFNKFFDLCDERIFILEKDESSYTSNILLDIDFNSINIGKDKLTFIATIDIANSDELFEITRYSLFKRDNDQLFKIQFLESIVENLQVGKIISPEAQNILLNISKIKKYSRSNLKSKFTSNNLDNFQMDAFNVATSNNDVSIIKGPPGTGKSNLITTLIKHFVFEQNKKVILASHTHAALNNVIEKISITSDKYGSYSGIIFKKSTSGDENKIYAQQPRMIKMNIRNRLLEETSEVGFVQKLLNTTHDGVKSLNRFIPSKVDIPTSVYFSTLASSSLDIYNRDKKTFNDSILIIDEVSRLSIVDVLRFANYASKVILVGDNKQLSPINDDSKHIEDFKLSLDNHELELFKHLFLDSIFEKLFDENFDDALILKNCYRSHEKIVSLYNKISYNNEIKALGNIGYYEMKNNELIQDEFYQKFFNHNSIFIHHNHLSTNLPNINESKYIIMTIEKLIDGIVNMSSKSVMVIFSYRKDYQSFKKNNDSLLAKCKKKFLTFKLGTIDSMQGQEADIVIYATGKNELNHFKTRSFDYINILQNLQRINVALSRAKEKILLIGNIDYIKKLELWDAEKKILTNHRWIDIIGNIECIWKVSNDWEE